jgi:hypothetical protein
LIKRIICAFLVCVLCLQASGCSILRPLKRKFIRKKKEEEPAPSIVTQFDRYEKEPNLKLYQRHYVYWKTWQEELISKIGENALKDLQCIRQIIANLNDMKRYLKEEKATGLDPIIAEMSEIKELIDRNILTDRHKDRVRRILEKNYRLLKREFYYKKVKEDILPD